MEAVKVEEPVSAAVIEDSEVNGVHDIEESVAGKRGREDDGVEDESVKKTKTEEFTEKVMDAVEEKEKVQVKLGPKTFDSSVNMFDYFHKLLHVWSPDLEINKYEELVLVDLIQRGCPEPEKKIGAGIKAFEVRYHPQWKSRCFFLVRTDGSCDDFSFRKCVDHILPLPDSMKGASAGKGGGAAGGRGGGRGRGGRGKRGGR